MCFLAWRDVLRQLLQPIPHAVKLQDASIVQMDCSDKILQAEICFCAYAPLATMEKAKEYRHRLPDGQEKFPYSVPAALDFGL